MEDSDDDNSNASNQIIFVAIVKKYPVIFNKSQMINVKMKKAEAYIEIKKKFNAAFGSNMTVQQIMKKLHNMKTRIKSKTDLRKAKNKRCRLKPWEEDFYKLMQENQTLKQTESILGTVGESDEEESMEPVDSKCWFQQLSSYSSVLDGPSLVAPTEKVYGVIQENQIGHKIKTSETEETKDLSFSELQRLVLLEQLQVLRLIKGELLQRSKTSKV